MTTLQPLDRRNDADDSDDGAGSAPESGLPWRARVPRFKIGPILPERWRPTTRPMPWLEIAMIAISYYLYSLTRLAAPDHLTAAYNRGFAILRLEHTLGFDFEHAVNHAVNGVTWLIIGMNYYYSTLHFIVPIAVLIWVYWKFPDRYRAIRTVIFACTGLALIGFFFYALCPPRLLYPPGLPGSFIDTIAVHGIWGQHAGATSDGVGGLSTSVTNEFAAMPSLHIGWSVWCALAIAHLARRKWVKVLGILYPCATFVVIISTANHYVLDAVFGLVTLAGAFLVQRVLQGRPVYAPAADDAGDGGAAGSGNGTSSGSVSTVGTGTGSRSRSGAGAGAGSRSGSGSGNGNAGKIADLEPGNALAAYLPALVAVNGSASHAGLDGFPEAWRAAAADPLFQKSQDDQRDKTYFDPAVSLAQSDGLGTLGQFAYYDALVMHGGDGLASIRAAALANAATPAQGGDETAYLNAFLDARVIEMKKEPAHSDTSRVDTEQRKFLNDGNLNLDTPLSWSVYGTPYSIG